jgi:hypothetical protein
MNRGRVATFHKWTTCRLLNVSAIYIAAVKKLWIRFFTSENGDAFPKLHGSCLYHDKMLF